MSRVLSYELDQHFSLAQTIEEVLAESQQHGPIYFIVLNLWMRLVGTDLAAARSLSLLFGMLAIATSYRLAWQMRRGDSAIYAICAIAFLAYFIFYSHTARMYTLLALAANLALWSYWRIVNPAKLSSKAHWLTLILSTAAIFYIHYFGVTILAVIALYHLFFVKKDSLWWRIAIVIGFTGMLILPWLPIAFDGLFEIEDVLAAGKLSPADALVTLLSIFSNRIIILPIAAVAIVLLRYRQLTQAEKYLIFAAAGIILWTIVVNEITAILLAGRMRYMTLLAGPICCVYAVALCQLPRSKATPNCAFGALGRRICQLL